MRLPRVILLRAGRSRKAGHREAARDKLEIIYRADYTSWWRLPPPLPPRRLPIVRLIVLAGVVLGSVMFAVGE